MASSISRACRRASTSCSPGRMSNPARGWTRISSSRWTTRVNPSRFARTARRPPIWWRFGRIRQGRSDYSTTWTSLDSMMRRSEVTRRSRWTRAVAAIARSAGSRKTLSAAISRATSQVNGRMRKTGLEFRSRKKSSRETFSAGFSPLARTAITMRLTALRATGSPRRTADSSARSCGRESFLTSNSHRMRTCVSNSKRGSRRRLLFRSDNFPEGRIPVHDVAHDLALVRPTVAGGLPDGLLCRAEHRHGAAPPGDGDGLSGLFDLAEAGEAFGLELRRAQYTLLHDSHDNRLYGHLTNGAGGGGDTLRLRRASLSDTLRMDAPP